MRTTGEHPNWAAFAAGALFMLVLALLWWAWSARETGSQLIRATAHVVSGHELPVPRLPHTPQTPQLPPPPKPVPK